MKIFKKSFQFINWKYDQEISSLLSLSFLIVASFVVAWFTVQKGEEMVESLKNSETFNMTLEQREKNMRSPIKNQPKDYNNQYK